MATVLPTLNEHIRKLARREVKGQTSVTKRASAQHRRDIAALKRVIKALASRVEMLERHGGGSTRSKAEAPAAESDNMRFRADGLKSHRARLDLSAKDFAQLLGVSALTVYNWESGKSRPRRKQLATLASIRGIGKKEAAQRLATTK